MQNHHRRQTQQGTQQITLVLDRAGAQKKTAQVARQHRNNPQQIGQHHLIGDAELLQAQKFGVFFHQLVDKMAAKHPSDAIRNRHADSKSQIIDQNGDPRSKPETGEDV